MPRKRLKYRKNTDRYIKGLTPIYLIGCWASYGVREYPFSGYFKKHKSGALEPLVYDFTDHNGTYEEWILRPISETTTGDVLEWTFYRETAENIANKFNYFNEKETSL